MVQNGLVSSPVEQNWTMPYRICENMVLQTEDALLALPKIIV